MIDFWLQYVCYVWSRRFATCLLRVNVAKVLSFGQYLEGYPDTVESRNDLWISTHDTLVYNLFAFLKWYTIVVYIIISRKLIRQFYMRTSSLSLRLPTVSKNIYEVPKIIFHSCGILSGYSKTRLLPEEHDVVIIINLFVVNRQGVEEYENQECKWPCGNQACKHKIPCRCRARSRHTTNHTYPKRSGP